MCMSWNKSSNYNNMHSETIKKLIIDWLIDWLMDWLTDWLTDCVVCIPLYYNLVSAYYNPSTFPPLMLCVKRFWTVHPWPIWMHCLISHLEILRRSMKICQDGHAWTNIQTGTYQKQSCTTNYSTATFCALTC